MPHQVHLRTLGRPTDHRLAMLRNLAVSALRYERVRTTEAKAKAVRRFVERAIGLGRAGTVGARRRAMALVRDPLIVEKLFDDLAKRYADRGSGFTRLVRLGHRVGDGAPMTLLELVAGEAKAPPAREPEAAAEPAGRPAGKKEPARPGEALPPGRPSVEGEAAAEAKGPLARARELARRATGRGAARQKEAAREAAPGGKQDKAAKPKAARKPGAKAPAKRRAPAREGEDRPASARARKKKED